MSGLRSLDSNSVVDSAVDPLFATEISLGGLDGHMSQQKLDLFQFASGNVTKLSTGSSQVVRGEVDESDFFGAILHHMPNNFLCYARAPMLTSSADAAKEPTSSNTAGEQP